MLTTIALLITLSGGPKITADSLMLMPGTKVELPKSGGFDYMNYDGHFGYVLASHTGAHTLAVYNIKTKTVMELPTGTVNGLEVVHKWNRIYAGGGGDVLCAINEKTLAIEKSVPLAGHGDALAVDTKDGLVFQCHDDGTELWVFDAKTLESKGTVQIGGVPEYIVYDPKTNLIYQNIKDKQEVQAIDPMQMKVVNTWTTGPLDTPSGLVFDHKMNVLVCAGRNGLIESFDPVSGKMLGSAKIGESIDQSTLDPKTHIVYSAGHGHISMTQITDSGLVSLGMVDAPKGAHTLTVDPKTGTVWICYSDSGKAYIQAYNPMK